MGGFNYDFFYKDKGFTHGPVDNIVKTLAEYLPQHSSVLDLGAGDGRHTLYLAQREYNITAVDGSQTAINILEEIARKATLRIAPVRANLTQTETLPLSAFNAIVCTYVLQDLSPAQTQTLATYAREHTMPGGYIAFSSFLGKFRSQILRLRGAFHDWHTVHQVNGHTRAAMDGKLYEKIEVLLQKPTSSAATPSKTDQQ